jgi:2-polyprenyl-3-methyl-5-hydroxy-6-metoxy-1,4-benzoquinol methylase
MAIHDTFYTNRYEAVRSFYNEDDIEDQVRFIESSLSMQKDDTLLDLACGFGRLTIPLAKKGYHVTGYDQSADYIEKAKQEAIEGGITSSFQVLDMRRLDAVEQFDAVISFSSSLAFYDDSANEDIIRRIHTALKPGGKFLFDQANIFSLVSLIAKEPDLVEKLSDGRTHRRRYHFDAEKCIVSLRSVVEHGTGQMESGWDLRYYTFPEMEALAVRTGFNIVNILGDYDNSQYTLDSNRLITVMKKT